MTTRQEPEPDDMDQTTARLLRLAGARPAVSGARAERVHAAVRLEWQHAVRRRSQGRRILLGSALLATAAAMVLAFRVVNPFPRAEAPPGDVVAVVERSDGAALAQDALLRAGEWIETSERARIALRFGRQVSLRLDAHTRLRALSASTVELASGGVYIDSGGGHSGFEVRTRMATARDIGTQFEVRVVDRGVRVRVRSGRVELRTRSESVSAEEATEVTLVDGRAVRRRISSHGPEWDWTARLAPAVDIEEMSLDAFLRHLAREHGWSIRYADPTIGRDAAAIRLHGSVAGLSAAEAAEVAVTTSGLRHTLSDGALVVFRSADAR
jgi:hypothetical protein